MLIFTLQRFWGFSVKFSRRWVGLALLNTSRLCGLTPCGGCGARIPLLSVVATVGVSSLVRLHARGVRAFGLPPACACKRTRYPHLREVK